MAWSAFEHNQRFFQYSISEITTLSIDQKQEKGKKTKTKTQANKKQKETNNLYPIQPQQWPHIHKFMNGFLDIPGLCQHHYAR